MNDDSTATCCETCHAHGEGHNRGAVGPSAILLFLPAIISFFLLLLGLAFDNLLLPRPSFFAGSIRVAWFGAACLPEGGPLMRETFQAFAKKELISAITRMTVATLGALYIGEYPEGVTVMLFYTVGENLQGLAVRRAKGNIKALLDQRPDEVTIRDGDGLRTIRAEQATIGQTVQLKPGEKLALDGELISERAS